MNLHDVHLNFTKKKEDNQMLFSDISDVSNSGYRILIVSQQFAINYTINNALKFVLYLSLLIVAPHSNQ